MSNRTCIIDGCERNHNAHGWCMAHYKKWQKYGDPLGEAGPRERNACSVDNCTRIMYARSFCKLHYKRHMTHGDLNHGRERRLCTVDECTEFRHSNGYCVKHHARWKRHGSATARLRGEIIDGKIICSACGADKPVADFHEQRAGRCSRCRSEYNALPEQRLKRRAWAATNAGYVKDYLRAYAHKRRVIQRESSGMTITPALLSARMAAFGNQCWMCGGDFEHIDHVKPLSKGGPHILSNLRPACAHCNLSKSNKWEGVAELDMFRRS